MADSRYNDSLGGSSAAKRENLRHKQYLTIVTICALAVLLLIALLILDIGSACSAGAGDERESGTAADDKIKWTTVNVTAADAKTGSLVLANASHPFIITEEDPSLAKIADVYYKLETRPYMLSGLSRYMNAEAMDAMNAMLTDCASSIGDVGLTLGFAFLTEEERKSVTTHGDDYLTGLGMELRIRRDGNTYAISTNPDLTAWLTDNAARYGFVVRYPDGKTDKTGLEESYTKYFRYVGVAHASYMKQNDLCLEEYIELLSKSEYTNKKPLIVNGADGKQYNVYCCPVLGTAEVDVPENYGYSIDGTNDGFVVVTIDRSAVVSPVEDPTDTSSTGDTTADTAPDTAAN